MDKRTLKPQNVPKRAVEAGGAFLWMEKGFVVSVETAKEKRVTLENAKERVETINGLSDGEPIGLLIVINPSVRLEREARLYFASREPTDSVKALAFYGTSRVAKMVANLDLKIFRPLMPTKFFNDLDEAAEWLRSTP